MSATSAVDIGTLIVSRPGVNGGRPCLAGTGMSVHAVAMLDREGLTAEQILDEYPDLDLARIHAALAYYHANKARIEAELEEEDRLYMKMAAKYPHGWTRETGQS